MVLVVVVVVVVVASSITLSVNVGETSKEGIPSPDAESSPKCCVEGASIIDKPRSASYWKLNSSTPNSKSPKKGSLRVTVSLCSMLSCCGCCGEGKSRPFFAFREPTFISSICSTSKSAGFSPFRRPSRVLFSPAFGGAAS